MVCSYFVVVVVAVVVVVVVVAIAVDVQVICKMHTVHVYLPSVFFSKRLLSCVP